MVTRITSSSMSSSLTNRINSSYMNYAKLSEQIASGSKINSLMDDSVQAINIISSNRKLNQIGTWIQNVQVLNNEIKQSSEVIDTAISKAQRIKDLTVTATTGTASKENLQSILTELDGVINTIVDRANTNYNGNYIYSGTNTTTPPYEIQYAEDNNGELTDKIVGIKYNGTDITDAWERKLEIADGEFQTCNMTGQEIFGECEAALKLDANGDVIYENGVATYDTVQSSGIMGDFISLRNSIQETIDAIEAKDALAQDDPNYLVEAEKIKTGRETMNGLIDKISLSMEKMSTANVKLGTLSNKLDMSESSLTGSKNDLTEFISDIKDVDITQAITEWYNAQYAYQASMQASLSALSQNLLSYL